jgi:hypothetical protein
MTPAFEFFAKIDDREWTEGRYATLTADVENDYHKEILPVIPQGTILKCDFGGEFGLYALADVNGVLHKVKILLHDLHKITFHDRPESHDKRQQEQAEYFDEKW